jgi:membrane protease YdiL (CAAX protease family)
MGNRLISYIAFAVLAILWLAFGVALLLNQPALDAAWQAFLAWPLLVKLVVGLLVLPVLLGLWIWQTTWPLWLRLVLVVGLALATVVTFFPKKTGSQAKPEIKGS